MVDDPLAVREVVLVDVVEEATLLARPCAFGGPLTDLDVVVPTLLVSGACVVLFERESSDNLSAFKSQLFHSALDIAVRDNDDCFAIVPGCIRPERALVKAELASFSPPGTRARADDLDCICGLRKSEESVCNLAWQVELPYSRPP